MSMMAAETADVTIRLASPVDAPMLAKLRFELRASMHETHESESAFSERCTRWMSERLTKDGPWRCWLAESEGLLVGSVWVQLIEKIPNPIAEPESYVYLTNFYVRPEHRSKGAGARLLAEALAWSREMKAELVLLWPTERSKPLYERHGFVPADDFMELVL
jgi:GNAT superfamily N-acetyltransferase